MKYNGLTLGKRLTDFNIWQHKLFFLHLMPIFSPKAKSK